MPHVNANGVSLHYQQAGAGPDVVLLHAVTANMAVWLVSNLVDTLARDYRVTAYDLRGHGLSEATPTGYTSADMAEDFRALHDALGLGPAYLIGHSFGAVVAMHVAATYPDRVSGMILSDPYFPGLARLEPNLGIANVWMDLREMFRHAGLDLGDTIDFTTLFRVVAGLSPAQLGCDPGADGSGFDPMAVPAPPTGRHDLRARRLRRGRIDRGADLLGPPAGRRPLRRALAVPCDVPLPRRTSAQLHRRNRTGGQAHGAGAEWPPVRRTGA